jgi:hypothetical protein
MTVSFPPSSSPVIPPASTPAATAALEEDVARAAAHGLPPPDEAGAGDPAAAADAVARALARRDHLDVRSFHDDTTGRFVTRVSDRWSGRVLLQTPPDEILRFLASAREDGVPPTVIDA